MKLLPEHEVSRTFKRRISFLLAFSMASQIMLVFNSIDVRAAEDKKVLEGAVNLHEYLRPSSGPSLERQDIGNKDPFSGAGDDTEIFDAPDESFQTQQPMTAPGPPQQNFDLNAAMQGFQGVPAMGMQQQTPTTMLPQQPAQMMMPPQQPQMSNDPDQTPQMQLAWDIWHKNVAEEIFRRFDAVAQRAFAKSRPLACRVAYTVTADGKIVDIKVLQKSPSVIFNSMLLVVLNSMNGNQVLKFPPGSRRQQVEKSGTFSRNFGVQGFKHTTGDRETIQLQQGH